MGTEHFDSKAATWDTDPDKVRQAQDVAQAVGAAVPTGAETRFLEYGAGTGLVTQALLDRVGPVVLADSSAGMRVVVQDKVASGALPEGTRVWDLDLEHQAPLPDRFDLIVSSMVLHHVRRLPVVLDSLVEMLAPGGHLCIADLDREDGSFHTHDFDGHHGFDRAALAESLEAVGLVHVSTAECTRIERQGTTYPVFLIAARKPGADGDRLTV